VLLTLARIGNYCVVDPTPEEESCTAASLVVGVTPDGRITTMRKMGAGSFHQHTLAEALKLGKSFRDQNKGSKVANQFLFS
jgi:exosome complex component RRP42